MPTAKLTYTGGRLVWLDRPGQNLSSQCEHCLCLDLTTCPSPAWPGAVATRQCFADCLSLLCVVMCCMLSRVLHVGPNDNRQTDATILNPVIPKKTDGGQIHLYLHDLHYIQLTLKRICWREYFKGASSDRNRS